MRDKECIIHNKSRNRSDINTHSLRSDPSRLWYLYVQLVQCIARKETLILYKETLILYRRL